MKTPTRVIATIALLLAAGCGSVSSGADGGRDGAAGQTGAAGTTGSAGHGAAGTTGSAGHGGSTGAAGQGGSGGGASCMDLQTAYAAALMAARSCTPGTPDQCAQLVSSSLSPCFSNCMMYVNAADALNSIKAAWQTAGCANQGPIACPAIACLQPTMGSCVATDGGGAVCSSVGVSPLGANTN
jgi:hypothetical protein